jgi:hypothetical protein
MVSCQILFGIVHFGALRVDIDCASANDHAEVDLSALFRIENRCSIGYFSSNRIVWSHC